jgi:aldose 1-epimerase
MIPFGSANGQPVQICPISGPGGLRAAVTPFGARLVQLWVPDRGGHLADIVLGHDTAQDYLGHPTYCGATCGRYANRIAGGQFRLDGVTHQLDRNEGPNHLHGGHSGFDKKNWQVADHGPHHITLTALSDEGDMGYPGACTLTTTYRFTEAGALRIDMSATTTRATLINMVNHAYFNMAGHDAGSVLNQHLQVAANHYTPVTKDLLTTGEVLSVADTGFDFRLPRPLSQAMASDPTLSDAYDHNWCLTAAQDHDGLHPCAIFTDPASGRSLTLRTNQPGVQIYVCGQMHHPVAGKGGTAYRRFAGLTLETQRFPCSPNHPQFPSARLDPGQTYAHAMEFTFSPA